MLRHILHFRIDAFPVAVERLKDPSLGTRPVAVCPRHSPRSPVFSVSPEARSEGVREGLPLTEALKRCRSLVVLPPDEALYRRAASAVVKVLERYSPLVEPGFWGRFHADMTGTGRLFGRMEDSAFRIKQAVRDSVRLDGALGIGSNKLVSGVASKVIASRGDLFEVPAGSEASFLAPLRVGMLPSVRSGMERSLLDEFNIRLVRQISAIPAAQLAAVFGKLGAVLHRQSLGIDETPVRPPEAKPFVLEEKTLDEDTNDDAVLAGALYGMVERACRALRLRGSFAKTAWLHLRYSDGMDVTRRLRLGSPTTADPVLFRAMEPFLLATNFRRQRIRYLSVTFTDLFLPPAQLPLFGEPVFRKEEALVSALDRLRSKYGDKTVQFGRTAD
jgi:DNA polymerase IV